MKQIRHSPAQSWLNRTVPGIAWASLFSDWSHEIATAVLPAFLGSLGVAAAWLGIIEGISDGLSSFAKLGSGFYTVCTYAPTGIGSDGLIGLVVQERTRTPVPHASFGERLRGTAQCLSTVPGSRRHLLEPAHLLTRFSSFWPLSD
jgi:hypothetical protein